LLIVHRRRRRRVCCRVRCYISGRVSFWRIPHVLRPPNAVSAEDEQMCVW